MKLSHSLFIVFALFFINNVAAQDFVAVDSKIKNYPAIADVAVLVDKLKTDFVTPTDKARAAYTWITTNVKYDVAFAENMEAKPIVAFSYKTEKERQIKEKKFKVDLANSTVTSKMAVCHGYAALLEYLLTSLGLEVQIIYGTIKTDPSEIGEIPTRINHAWNTVKIDGVWRFIDTTLGSGFISQKTNLFKFYFNDSYFFTKPERFFLNHYPVDSKWLLVPKTKSDFALQPVYFGLYFKNNYEILREGKGIVSSSNEENFAFTIKGLEEFDSVQCSFNVENKSIFLKPQNGSGDFVISLKGRKDNYLSIYVNREIIAIYKII